MYVQMWLLSLWVFSTGAIISSILVITSGKAINAIINLILAFINGIGIFILLGLDFIALIYCIVYVGAIAILFLFVIMLLNTQMEGWTPSLEKKGKSFFINNRPMAVAIGLLFIIEIWCGLLASTLHREVLDSSAGGITHILHKKTQISGLGEMLYKECGYEVLVVISLILLVGMIGSIVLTLTPKNGKVSPMTS
jgi:NADH-quinone oxidoreductase subunit J